MFARDERNDYHVLEYFINPFKLLKHEIAKKYFSHRYELHH